LATAENGFVHVVLRIRPGRQPDVERRLGETVFAAACAYLDSVFRTTPLALSFEVQEIDVTYRFMKNNMEEFWRPR
jgi:5-carboxymethyl-2-hydroxymuconate isomerase